MINKAVAMMCVSGSISHYACCLSFAQAIIDAQTELHLMRPLTKYIDCVATLQLSATCCAATIAPPAIRQVASISVPLMMYIHSSVTVSTARLKVLSRTFKQHGNHCLT